MRGNVKWLAGVALAGGLLIESMAPTGALAQIATGPAPELCPGAAMMGSGFGLGAEHAAIAATLGMSSQELWDARAAGRSVADLASERNVDLSAVVDAAMAAHSVALEAAVQAGTLTQTQADAMNAVMRNRIQTQFRATGASGSPGRGTMMGGRGMSGPGFGWP
jgi:hypothetical protein